MNVYYEVVSYTQTYKKQLFIINEHGTLNACHCLVAKPLKNKGFINLKIDKKVLVSLKNDEYLINEYLTMSWENMFPRTGLLLKDVLQNIFF